MGGHMAISGSRSLSLADAFFELGRKPQICRWNSRSLWSKILGLSLQF